MNMLHKHLKRSCKTIRISQLCVTFDPRCSESTCMLIKQEASEPLWLVPLIFSLITLKCTYLHPDWRVRVKMCLISSSSRADSCTNSPRFPTSPGARTASYSSLCSWTPYHPSIARWRSSLLCARYNKDLKQLILPFLLLLLTLGKNKYT